MITRSDLSLGAVRILALYLIACALRLIPALVMMWPKALDSEALDGVGVWLAAGMAVPLLIGVLIAVFSRPISRWILPRSREASVEMPGASLVQSVAIGTFGLFLIAADLPDMVVSVMTPSTRNELQNQSTVLLQDSMFLRNLLSVGMGVVLCTGAAFWSRLITMFRRIGSAEPSGPAT